MTGPVSGRDRQWLTETLQARFPGARVRGIGARDRGAANSRVFHLELEWDPPRAGPRRIVWKRDRDEPRECQVWALLRRIAATRPGLPVPACFAAQPEGILLEDLSTTHAPPVEREDLLAGRGVPAEGCAERVVDSLAALHAAAWEWPELGTGVAAVRDWFRDEASHARHRERRREEWSRFRRDEKATIYADVYEEALEVLERLASPAWFDRLRSRRALTLVQGDAYLNQFLVPRSGEGPAVVIDFGDATANPGTWDLAFLMTTFWTPEQRNEGGRERKLLRRYHAGLGARGVDVPEEDILRDYRRMIAYLVFDPVWNAVAGSSRGYWEPKMACLTAAWRDWDCGRLES